MIFVGIDVSKAHLDVALRPTRESFRVGNTPEGIAGLIGRLKDLAPELVVLEATGGYERELAVALAEAGVPARVVDPSRARHFARSLGQYSKTDTIDAHVLAHFAEAVRPEARALPGEKTREVQALCDRRSQLIQMRTAEKNRLRTALARVRAGIAAHIRFLEEEIERTNDSLAEQIKADPEWESQADLLRGIPGIGAVTSRILIGHLPELGKLTGKQVAALAGLAPRARDSGTVTGTRSIFGGRRALRTALYSAAIPALRSNPTLKAFYKRLRQSGKAAKVAIVAVARKLLTIANAIIRDRKPWTPTMAGPAV